MVLKVNSFLKTGVTRKILVLLFASGIMPLVILAIVFFSFYFKGQQQGVIDIQKEICERIATSISGYLDKTSGQIQLFASTLRLEAIDNNELHFLLNALLDQVVEFDKITVADLEGKEVCKVSRYYTFRPFELDTIAENKSFQTARAGKINVSKVEISPLSKFPRVQVSTPIIDVRDRVAGVLIVDVNVFNMWNYISKYRIGENRYAYIVDSEGFLIAYQDLSSVLQKRNLSHIESVGKLLNGKTGVFEYEGLIGERVIGANAIVSLTGWGVIVEMAVKDAYRNLYLLSALFLGLFVLTLMLSASLGFRFSLKRIIEPIYLLQKEAETIAKGEFGSKINLQSTDELGQLAATFNLMSENLNHTTVSRDLLVKEISEHKKTDEALKKSEATLKSIFRAAPIGIGLVSDRVLLWVNQHLLGMLGYSDNELVGQSDRVFYLSPEEFDRVEHEKYLQISNLGAGSVETRWQRKDGGIIDVLLSSSPLDASDISAGVTFTALDITERNRALAAMRESEARYRRLHESMMDCFVETKMSGEIVDVNPSYLAMLGYSEEEIYNLSYHDLTPESWHSFEQGIVETQILPFGHSKIYEKEYIRKDGTVFPVEMRTFLLRDAEGLPTGMWAIVRDLTERMRAEEAKAKFEAQSRELQKAESLGRMAGAIAHHFNNQLAVVLGNLELMTEDLPQGKVSDRNLSEAANAARKAAEISGLMLTYLGQTTARREPLDICDVCRLSLTLLRATLPLTIRLSADFPSPGPTIEANAKQIQQVLTNLITNAVESYTGESHAGGGDVCLSVKTVPAESIPRFHRYPVDWLPQDRRYVCLEVKDSGCGIAQKDIEKIFDPFFTSKFAGRGLGLAVVLGLLRAHAGAITVESQLGRGSIFRVFLPLSGEAVVPSPDIVLQAPEIVGSGTVLLVEDEEQVRNVAKMMLSGIGFTVLEAGDGIEAVAVFRRHRDEIRWVFCDLTMPRMSGWETLAALRSISPGIPVIFASGHDEGQVMLDDHPERPDAFLHKPFSRKELAGAIQKALNKV